MPAMINKKLYIEERKKSREIRKNISIRIKREIQSKEKLPFKLEGPIWDDLRNYKNKKTISNFRDCSMNSQSKKIFLID